jgi:hypothetical protein
MLESMRVEVSDDFMCTLVVSDDCMTVGEIKQKFH